MSHGDWINAVLLITCMAMFATILLNGDPDVPA